MQHNDRKATQPANAAAPIHIRHYGTTGPLIILLHGGPGAPGYVAPIARGLADAFQIIEPFQRVSGKSPLTVAQHVADLHEIIQTHGSATRPVLVGHSWGAMLALAYAAVHTETVGPLVLIGCGTFDTVARERLKTIRRERMDFEFERRQAALLARYPDPDDRLKIIGSLHQRIDSVDLISHKDETAAFDARAHEETWADMLRLQAEGLYPASFAAIRNPVLMLHGAEDPHPGSMIRDSLAPFLPQLEYHELQRCGHYPWLEKAAKDDFYAVLRDWLAKHIGMMEK